MLRAVFRFRHSQGSDYYSTRLLSHFLLHCDTGLKVAQIARLLGISRPNASNQQKLSSKEAIQQAHHRLDGRPTGKLLPRYAGPIAAFLLSHPKASQADLIAFVGQTFDVQVSRIALYKFLKKYGLDQIPKPSRPAPGVAPAPPRPHDAPAPAILPARRIDLDRYADPGDRTGPSHRSEQAVAAPFFFGRTQYAGAFLLMGEALDWLAVARDCIDDPFNTLTRGLLTSIFAPIVGLPRIWHLEEMEDLGFALLSGGLRCPSRQTVGGWRRHLPWYEVDAFCRRTSPWYLLEGDKAVVSYDEHTIPRWTHKFKISKGYVTTRNKYMRCEKLFYAYDVLTDRYLAVRATPGDWRLSEMARAAAAAGPAIAAAPITCMPSSTLLGAGPSDAGVRALLNLAAEYQPRLDVTLRACRYPHRIRLWKALPAERFTVLHEPGPYVNAPSKEVRLAETGHAAEGGDGRAGGADGPLPGGGAWAEEGPLASLVHDRLAGPRRGAGAVPAAAAARAGLPGGGA